MEVGPSEPAVAQQPVDVGMPRDQPLRGGRVPQDRMVVAEALVDGIGIGDERRIRRVEAQVERRHVGHDRRLPERAGDPCRRPCDCALPRHAPCRGCPPTVGRGRADRDPGRSFTWSADRRGRRPPGGGHMRIRSTGLTLFVGLSILVAACNSGTASTAPSAAAPSTAPTTAASAPASTAPSEAPSVKPTSDLKIGVVTDVGKVNDKNFNQFSYAGAVNGAVSIGAKTPSVVVPPPSRPTTSLTCRRTSTGRATTSSLRSAVHLIARRPSWRRRTRSIWFIGVDHNLHRQERRHLARLLRLLGYLAMIDPNYIAMNYQEDQAGSSPGDSSRPRPAGAASSARSVASRSAARAFATSRASTWVRSRSTRRLR